MDDVALYVERVKVEGVVRTNADLVSRQLEDLFRATSSESLYRELQIVDARLENLGVFKDIKVTLDASESSSSGGDPGGPEPVIVTVEVKEKNRVQGKVQLSMEKEGGEAASGITLRNVLGHAEVFSGEVQYRGERATSFQGRLSTPLSPTESWEAVTSLSQNHKRWAMHEEEVSSAAVNYTRKSMWGLHKFSYGSFWRRNHEFAAGAPLELRMDGGHSLKSAVSHVFEVDRRDNNRLPTRGWYMKATQELAGLGGNVTHLSNDVKVQLNRPLWPGWSSSLSLWGGHLWNAGPGRKTLINDRFFLGGGTSLRGFGTNGVHRVKGAAVGGDAFWALGLHLYGPFMPHHVGDAVKTHAFATMGRLYSRKGEGLEALGSVRSSVGVGVCASLGPGRLELNYCVPLVKDTGDDTSGISFGGIRFAIGVDCL